MVNFVKISYEYISKGAYSMTDTQFLFLSILVSVLSVVLYTTLRLRRISQKSLKLLEVSIFHLVLLTIFSSLWFFKIAIDGISQVLGLMAYIIIYSISYITTMFLINLKSRAKD